MELGYARVSTAKKDLDRHVDALSPVGIAPERIDLNKKSGANTDRPGVQEGRERHGSGAVGPS